MSKPEIRTVPAFVKAAQAGDSRANEMVVGCLHAPDAKGRWQLSRASAILEIYGGSIRYATGTDGRLLVEVLDALSAIDARESGVASNSYSDALGLRRVADTVMDHNCTRNIAACAALLAAMRKLEEK